MLNDYGVVFTEQEKIVIKNKAKQLNSIRQYEDLILEAIEKNNRKTLLEVLEYIREKTSGQKINNLLICKMLLEVAKINEKIKEVPTEENDIILF